MKTFDELKQTLLEYANGPFAIDGGNAVVDGGRTWDISYRPFFEKVNQYLEYFSSLEFFDPVGAVNRLRGEMNLIGLDFPYTSQSHQGIFPLQSNTEMIGSQRPDGTFIEMSDDGITRRLGHPLSLSIQFQPCSNGKYCVQAEMINPNESVDSDLELDD